MYFDLFSSEKNVISLNLQEVEIPACLSLTYMNLEQHLFSEVEIIIQKILI